MGPEKVATYAEQIAAEVYGLLSFEDRQAIMFGEFPLVVFQQARDRYKSDRYPHRPTPEWDRDFKRALLDQAVWTR